MLHVFLTADETGRVSSGPTASSLPTLLLLIRLPGGASLLIMRTRHIWSEQQVSVPDCGIVQRNPSHPGRNQESPHPLWYYKAYTIDLSCSLSSPGQNPCDPVCHVVTSFSGLWIFLISKLLLISLSSVRWHTLGHLQNHRVSIPPLPMGWTRGD